MCLKKMQLRWFDLRAGHELQADADGIFRMKTFPGLWIHGAALLAKDHQRMTAALSLGLASPEHAEFVKRLAVAHLSLSQKPE